MQAQFTDKDILGDALTTEKTCTRNYNTYSNECVHEDMRGLMLKILGEEHEIQDEVFKMMHGRGFYPTPEAEEKKVQEAKSKFKESMKAV